MFPDKKKHMRNIKWRHTQRSNITIHAWDNKNEIGFENACIIDRGSYQTRKSLKSWHTGITKAGDNNSKPPPAQ